jgi:hypothetical protein
LLPPPLLPLIFSSSSSSSTYFFFLLPFFHLFFLPPLFPLIFSSSSSSSLSLSSCSSPSHSSSPSPSVPTAPSLLHYRALEGHSTSPHLSILTCRAEFVGLQVLRAVAMSCAVFWALSVARGVLDECMASIIRVTPVSKEYLPP